MPNFTLNKKVASFEATVDTVKNVLKFPKKTTGNRFFIG